MSAPEPHRWNLTVRIFDLDAYGHTNHTVFLQWLEEGRESFLRRNGFSFLRFLEEGTPLVMVNLNVDYKGQVSWGDEIVVETGVGRLGGSSVRFDHRVIHAGGIAVLECRATMVFVNGEGRPVPIPGPFRGAMEG